MDQATQTMIENLHTSTGRSLEQWIAVVRQEQLPKHGEILKFLKEQHGLTHGYANLIAHKSRGSDAASVDNQDDLIVKQYQGKEHLRPLYDALMQQISRFGDDVEIAPKNAYVSLRRKKQFAMLQPATKTRFEIGLNLKGQEPSGKLQAINSSNAMCSHKINLASTEDIDTEVLRWIKLAYDNAG
ncbi:MAG: DUF4287 domain-containing protein [Bacteroidia bacterium]|nr:DUF4287 domain-containing protein [Bacteroidia bacterium]